MSKENKIVFFIGPSSSGKDTFFAKSKQIYQVQPITLLTTRPMRDGEKNGEQYFFISMEEMNNLDANHLLIERRDYEAFNGIWSYATRSKEIDLTKFNHITLNTWNAYSKFLKFYPKENLVPIYFDLDKGTRLQRALDREKQAKTSNYAEMCRRFLADAEDFREELIDLYKPYVIDNNGTIEETMEQIDDVFVHKLGIKKKI